MPRIEAPEAFQTVGWAGDALGGHLRLIDQTRLPTEFVEIDCHDVATVWEAIKLLRVRGAPAIGMAAAYGAVVGGRPRGAERAEDAFGGALARSLRPPADQPAHGGQPVLGPGADGSSRLDAAEGDQARRNCWTALLAEAQAIADEDRADVSGDRPARRGADRAGRGRAHALQRRRAGHGRLRHRAGGHLLGPRAGQATSTSSPTRPGPCCRGPGSPPGNSSSRGVPVTLICDNMAAQVMKEGKVQAVVVGADRIAANGDTANKIGTYGVALLARRPRHPLLRRRAVEHVRPDSLPTARRFRSNSATRAK